MHDQFEQKYWEDRYSHNLGSGEGSRGDLLKFKAEYLNEIFRKYGVESVFDFGCGDGYLAHLLDCKNYYGVDISQSAVNQCRKLIKKPNFIFEHGRFGEYPPTVIKRKFNGLFGVDVDAVMCIDVLYHVMDEHLVDFVLRTMFESSAKIVILYTIPNEKMDGHKHGGFYLFNTDRILSEVTQGYLLVSTTKPRGISGASFYVWRHNAN
jgi:2-polyprenyl-3-methyl-5-hydroxy-6-metoxy-1,4-benzoquinol methylase